MASKGAELGPCKTGLGVPSGNRAGSIYRKNWTKNFLSAVLTDRDRTMALQTQRQVSLPWGGGAASNGYGRVPEPEGETVPTARDLPLEDPDHALVSPSSAPSCPLLPRFSWLPLLPSLFSFFLLWLRPLVGLRSSAASRVLNLKC